MDSAGGAEAPKAPPLNPQLIFVRHMNCQKQTNGNDCGASAIANMVSILHGIDPDPGPFGP